MFPNMGLLDLLDLSDLLDFWSIFPNMGLDSKMII